MNKLLKSAAIGLAIAAMSAATASAEIVLRYSEAGPNRGTRAKALEYYAQQVEELSKGEIKLDIHWGGALLKWGAVHDGVAAGTADMGSVLAPYAPNELKALSMGDLPVGNSSDAWIGMRAMYDLQTSNEQLQKSLADNGLVYISNYHTTGIQLECKGDMKIESLADVKGKKMRASGVYAKVLKDAGANMVSLTYGKVYQAFDSGLIECDAGYFYANRAYKLYEVVDNITRADWGQVAGFAIVMNKYMWDDMNDEQKAILREAGSKMIDYFAELQIDSVDGMITDLESGKLGKTINVTTMAPEARAEFVAAAQPYVASWKDEFAKDGFDGDAVWNQYNDLLDKYSKIRDDEGYPWTR